MFRGLFAFAIMAGLLAGCSQDEGEGRDMADASKPDQSKEWKWGSLPPKRNETYEWRQRVTVEVETPAGLRTGSAVQEVRLSVGGPVPGYGYGTRFRTDAEAVVVDVRPDAGPGEPRYLFALLIGEQTNQWRGSWGTVGSNGLDALVGTERFRGDKDPWPVLGKLGRVLVDLPLGATGEVPEKAMPAFATFLDIDDPTSVKVVVPEEMERWFGAGVRINRITITKTDEAVTAGRVEKVIGWIIKNGLTAGGGIIKHDGPARAVADMSAEERLNATHFIAGRWIAIEEREREER